MSHRLSLPMLISCLKDRRDVLQAADPRDEHSLVGGLPGLLTQAIERLEELDAQGAANVDVASTQERCPDCGNVVIRRDDAQRKCMACGEEWIDTKWGFVRHPTRAEIG